MNDATPYDAAADGALADIAARVASHGLLARGAFHPTPGDGVPGDPGTLVMVGNAGPAMWKSFSRARSRYREGADPLDAWIRDVLGEAAGRFGGTALFPFGGPPYLPFQRWARKAEPVHPSPLGVLIHPDFGLWHAWRGAIALPGRLDLPPADDRPSPCESCADRPCLTACPVGAFGPEGYDVAACAVHIAGPDSAACIPRGCAARRACPVGRAFVYEPAQAEFHMRAFLGAQG